MTGWTRLRPLWLPLAAATLSLALPTPPALAQAAPASPPGLAPSDIARLMLAVPPIGDDPLPGTGPLQTHAASDLTPHFEPTTTLLDVLTTAPATNPASEAAAAEAATSKKFSLTFELPIWAAGINGTVGVHGFTAPVNACFSEILQATDSVIGLAGRVEADYGPWIFFLDGLYMKLAKDNVSVGPASVNFVSTLGMADAGILYRLGSWSLAGQDGHGAPTLDVAAGAAARYMYVEMSLDTARGLSRSQNQEWADPLAAGQLTLDFDQHWQLLVRGDVGAGPNTDLTWAAGAYVSYQCQFSSTVSGALKLGYQAVSEDYHHGSGRDRFTWDVILNGPMLVLAIKF